MYLIILKLRIKIENVTYFCKNKCFLCSENIFNTILITTTNNYTKNGKIR